MSVLAEREIKKHSGSIKRDFTKKKKRPSVKRDIKPMNNPRPVDVGEKMNINNQTLKERKSARAEKRINPNSPEVKKGARKAQNYKIKKDKKGVNRVALVYTVIFVVIFILISVICGALFYSNLVKVDTLQYSRIKVKIGLQHQAEELKSVIVDETVYYQDGNFYINMTDIAEEFGFIITGDHKQLRFITNEKNGEEVRFLLNSDLAEVNGSSIKLDGRIKKIDGEVYVPANFVVEYMNGIEFSFDEEQSTISVLRNTSRNEAGRFVSSDIGFRLHTDKITSSLPEDELSEAEQAKCYFKGVQGDENNLQQQDEVTNEQPAV